MKLSNVVIDVLSRVEGHGSLYLELDPENRSVKRIELKISEGARFFEYAIRGRSIYEAPLIMSRICGICGVSHAVCSAKALENALGINVPREIELIREAMLELNIIDSHLLHISILSIPDYYGVRTFLELPLNVKGKVINIIKLRNYVGKALDMLSGERIHPRNIIPGGFTKLPSKERIAAVARELNSFVKDLESFIELIIDRMLIEFKRPSHYASLYSGNDYSVISNKISIDSSYVIDKNEYDKYFVEKSPPYSTSKKVLLQGSKNFMVGALSRINTNRHFMVDEAKYLLRKINATIPSTNPYLIPLAQLIETLHMLCRATDILSEVQTKTPRVQVKLPERESCGIGLVEAPRGVLYHSYVVNKEGRITFSNVITPTAQNTADIENSVKIYVEEMLNKSITDKEIIKRESEKIVRCYDPCISCSVHAIVLKR